MKRPKKRLEKTRLSAVMKAMPKKKRKKTKKKRNVRNARIRKPIACFFLVNIAIIVGAVLKKSAKSPRRNAASALQGSISSTLRQNKSI